jgi:hypothetical protein
MKIQKTLLGLLTAGLVGISSAQASVRVYGEATSTGPTINVQVFADITAPAVLSFSFKLFYPAGQLQPLSVYCNEALWYFHDGTRLVSYPAPDTATPGQILFIGGHMDARDPLAGVTGNHVLLGTVQFNRTTQSTPNFDMTIGRTGQFASFVAVNGSILESAPGQVTIQSVTSDSTDQDLDGLNDQWEEQFFGSTKDAFYSDDPDRDGVNNRDEAAMGSDPTDPRSLLRLAIGGEKEKYVLEWNSAQGRVYTIEGARSLNRFEELKSGIPATPPLNTFEIDRAELGDIMFFRVRVDPDRRR